MTPQQPCRRAANQFRADESGMSAVEFAFVLPVLLSIFIGVTEVGQAISISRKVTITTRTITDLVTQNTTLTQSQLNTLLEASAETIAPYASNNLSITVSEIYTNSSGQSTVCWSGSYPYVTNALTPGTTFQLPANLLTAGSNGSYTPTYLLYGMVSYAYTPTFGYNIIGTMSLADHIYLAPRNSSSVIYTGTPSPSC
jgi:Flp pilus assembly protein TadG